MNSNLFFINEQEKLLSLPAGEVFSTMGAAEQQLSGWVASEKLNFFSGRPPVYKKSVIQETAPFMMEEFLIEPLDNYHFTVLLKGRDKPIFVVAATHQSMGNWTELIKSANIKAKALYPDILALPYKEGTISVYASRTRLLVRTAEVNGFCGKGQDKFIFSLIEQQAEQEQKEIAIYAAEAAAVPSKLRAKIVEEDFAWLEHLTRTPLPTANHNLLHGDYSFFIKQFKGITLNQALAYAAAAALLVFGADFARLYSYQSETQYLEGLSRSLYSQMFNQRIGDLSQLRNLVLVNLQDVQRAVGEEDEDGVWFRTRQMSDILASCPGCNMKKMSINEGSNRIEIIFESQTENAFDPNIFAERGWRVLATRSESVPLPENLEPLFITSIVLQKA